MKLNSTYDNAVVASNCELDGTTFRIKACPEAFKILTDNLYNDKIQTIIRELSCNAYDSHVQNGNPNKPFDIHVPDKLNPIFYIRDYGTGLTKEEIKQIYTTYFESTKSSSNDYIGAFGLGSKTPLAYTDQFTVTSYKDGMEYAYRVYTSDKGFPEIQLVIERETTEPNGLKVQISVENNDIEEFKRDIKKFFSFNNINPRFLNVEIKPELEVLYTYKNLYLLETYDYSNTYLARIGMVVYPIPRFYSEEVLKYIPGYTQGFSEFVYYMTNSISYGRKIMVDFNIGELSVTASRESLSMDKATKEALYKKIANILFEMYNNCLLDLKKITKVEELIPLMSVYPLSIYKKIYSHLDNSLSNEYFSYSDLSLKLNFAFHREIEQAFEKVTVLNYVAAKSGFRYNHSRYEYYSYLTQDKIFTIKIGNLNRSDIREINLPSKKSFTYIKVKTKEEAEKVKDYIETKFPKELFQVDINFIEKEEKPKKVYNKEDRVPVIENLTYCNITDRFFQTYQGKASERNKEQTMYFLPKNICGDYKDILRYYNPEVAIVYLLTTTQERILTRSGYKLENLERFLDSSHKDKFGVKVKAAGMIYDVLRNFREDFNSLVTTFNLDSTMHQLRKLINLTYDGYYYNKAEKLQQRFLSYYDNRIVKFLKKNPKEAEKVVKSLLKEAFEGHSYKASFLEDYFEKTHRFIKKSVDNFLKL